MSWKKLKFNETMGARAKVICMLRVIAKLGREGIFCLPTCLDLLKFFSVLLLTFSENSFLWHHPLNSDNHQSFCHGNLKTRIFPGERKSRNQIQEGEQSNAKAQQGHEITWAERGVMGSKKRRNSRKSDFDPCEPIVLELDLISGKQKEN